MLKSLYISNYALISELHIDFNKGFSVITGETGAGKSIILGALSLILGQRAETKAIKSDADKCVIEAQFDVSEYQFLNDFFIKNDLDFEATSCIIRRELTSNAKSRAFINDTPVSLNILRDLSSRLIDIHSQHDNLLLSNEHYQLELVDTIAQNELIKSNYFDAYTLWQNQLSELKKMENNANKYAAELDYLQFQFQQLNDANLVIGEQEELELEQDTLVHAEEIKSELMASQHYLDDEKAALPLLKDVITAISKIQHYIKESDNWIERLNVAYIEMKDIYAEITMFADKVEFNPQRLEWVEQRLNEIYSLQKKYKVSTIEELLEIRDNIDSQLQKIDSFDDDIIALKKKIELSNEQLKLAADELTLSRKKATEPIETYLIEHLSKLGMPNIQFKVDIKTLAEYNLHGIDEVQFLFSANKNRAVQPVQLIASGGEVSRLMLSIKSLVANKSDLPTIIFDEIDTGVSGEIAHRMGDIMQTISNGMQVITITHLPQIAAKSSHHYRVYKDDTGEQTQTYIQYLTQEERIAELAQMLSGKNLTEASILNAKELLGLN